MKWFLVVLSFFTATICCHAQSDTLTGDAAAKRMALLVRNNIDTAKFLAQSGNSACSCIDSLSLSGKDSKDLAAEIGACIDKQVDVYELSLQLYRSMASGSSDNTSLSISPKGSRAYTNAYRNIENWLMDSCKVVRSIVAASNRESDKSFSTNENSLAAYSRGVEQMKKENYQDARDYFKTAVSLDEQFAFAWDNLGLCERKLGNYDAALSAYNKSLAIDPKGHMPMQNIAIVYEYKKDYGKALEAYQNILKYYPDDPEAWYGEGRIYTFYNTDWEKALNAMCKAYTIYTNTQSPYRVDAEKNIQYIYGQMKQLGKEKEFNKILKENNISTN